MSMYNVKKGSPELEAAIEAAYNAWKEAQAKQGPPLSCEDVSPDPRSEAIDQAWHRSGVPKIFRDVPDAEWWGWAYIAGPVGAGKSHLAASMLRRFIDETCSEVVPGLWTRPKGYFCTAQDYLERIKVAFNSDDDRAVIWRGAELLVVDDLGQEQPTEWAISKLFDLINHRYEEQLPTIFTSQFALSAIESRLAEGGNPAQAKAIASRLMGACRSIRLESGDRRRVA